MRIPHRVLLLAGVWLAGVLSVHAENISGQWTAEFDTQIGVQKYTFDFKVEGEKLTGKASFERMNQKGEADLQEGKVSGENISFIEKFSIEGNEISISYTGKISGDAIKFHRQVGEFASEDFVAKRAK